MEMSRRKFVQLGAALGAGMILPLELAEKALGFTLAGQALPANPLLLTKYLDQLPVRELTLPAFNGLMPSTGTGPAGETLYDVGVYQFQSLVHSQMAPTTVWSYRPQGWTQGAAPENTFLAPSFAVQSGVASRVTWHNNLNGVSHPLPIDPSLHWADPLGDSPPMGSTYPVNALGQSTFDYTLGTVPIVPHVHGGEQAPGVDGGPDAWFTPGLAQTGPTFTVAGDVGAGLHNVYPYTNAQPPATIWYHDHALGITRLNVYMGMAGAYVVYDPALEPAGVPSLLNALSAGTVDQWGNPYDIPIVIQDRMFDATGQLYFPAVSVNPTVNPFWVPEFFGDTILVNGKAWPNLNVEPREYRFRMLNGSNARFYALSLVNGATGGTGPAFTQIATDGGYLGTPAPIGKELVMGTGERAEVVVDFRNFAGQKLIMKNTARTPYPKGAPVVQKTTGQIMQFTVAATPVTGVGWTPPAVINPGLVTFPSIADPVVRVRSVTLNEWMGLGGPLMATENNTKWPHEHPGMPGHIMAPTTELPTIGTTEVWEIINTTGDTHPIHLHLVQFQLISRQAYNTKTFNKAYIAAFGGMDPGMMEPMGPPYSYDPVAGQFVPNPAYAMMPGYVAPPAIPAYQRTLALSAAGAPITAPVVGGNPDIVPFLQGKPMWTPPEERGWKDTVKMNPGEVTRILVRFKPIDGAAAFPFDATAEPGYVWHCHIIDHEDNEMMRPYKLLP